MTSTMERRLYHRVGASLKAEEQVMIESGTHWVCATIVNLSAAGALLRLSHSEAHFPAGDTFKLFLDNGGSFVQLKATVVRAGGREIAFEFSDLSPDTKTAIQPKSIRMAITSAQITPIDANEVPQEYETSQSAGRLGLFPHLRRSFLGERRVIHL